MKRKRQRAIFIPRSQSLNRFWSLWIKHFATLPAEFLYFLLLLLPGIRMGSLGLFLQCATSTFFSLIMRRLVCRFGSRRVYVSSMVSFTASTLVICLSKSIVLVTAMAALTGYAYATLQTLPYTLTCHYHKEQEVSSNQAPFFKKNNIKLGYFFVNGNCQITTR